MRQLLAILCIRLNLLFLLPIELLEDRLYVVTCGRAGFQNSRNEVSVVELKVTLPSDPTRKINTVLEGRRYKLRAEVLEHDRE